MLFLFSLSLSYFKDLMSKIVLFLSISAPRCGKVKRQSGALYKGFTRGGCIRWARDPFSAALKASFITSNTDGVVWMVEKVCRTRRENERYEERRKRYGKGMRKRRGGGWDGH